jgi:flagellar FliL protein
MREDDMSEIPAPPPKSKMLPFMVLVVAGLVGALVFTMKKKGDPSSASSSSAAGPESKGTEGGGIGPTLHLESFVVPLKSNTVERFAHVTLDLELGSEEEKSRINGSMPVVRDTVISFLIDQTVDDLRGSEGVAHVKEEVLSRLRKALPNRRISNVYVTDFIVQ